jgi:Flp pilus assembly protein TadD
MSEAYQLYQKGLAALAAGHADEAIVPLERAKRLEPESMSIHEALGKTYLSLGFLDRAVEEFSTIISKEPLDAYAHFCLGRAYDKLDRTALARRHYRLANFYQPDRAIYRDTLRAFLARNFPDGDDHLEDSDDDFDGIVEA